MKNKSHEFQKILNLKLINIKELKDISWGGIPDQYRSKAWLYLLDIVSIQKDNFDKDIEKIRANFYLKIEKGCGRVISLFKSISYDRTKILNNKTTFDPHLNDNFNSHNFNNKNLYNDGFNNEKFSNELGHLNDEFYENTSKSEKINKNIEIYEQDQPDFKRKAEDKIIKQIKMDVRRLEHYSCEDDIILKNKFILLLLLVADKCPSVGYIQGMADLLQPFMMVYSDIPIIYVAYCRFIDSICDSLVESQACIYMEIEKIKHILSLVEPELYIYMNDIDLKFHNFVFRWLSCFFFREFPISMYLRILDTYFSTTFYKKFPIYFSVAILSFLKKFILGKDFSDALIFIQNCKNVWEDGNLDVLFSKVFVYHETFSDSFLFRSFK
ncbi:TBC1 domain family member 22A [Dictyocoela muelleri]|nr:TBC1 domain family member 22A [Dictyocoela muelleri]